MEYHELLQTEYDNFKLSLLFANESYDKQSIRVFNCKFSDTQYLFTKINNDYFISFAGTESVKDALTDANLAKQGFAYNNRNSNIRIHEGFHNAYRSVREYIMSMIKEGRQRGDRFFISGHSLGGALAVLCALDIQYNFENNQDIFCFTLGQPRLGNAAFKNSTNRRLKSYFRFVNGDDVVPKWPKIGYEHCGKIISIGDKSKWKLFSFSDHHLSNYLRKLFAL